MAESTKSTSPLYNLSLVLNETGLKADVLRVWERRYGIPKPGRSAGGHRLYSRRDIDTVKWLQSRIGEGMSIRRAADLWKELAAAGRDPLSEYRGNQPASYDLQPDAGLQLEILRTNWLDACLAYNRYLADHILTEALALYPVERICVEIFQQGLYEVGERWYHGMATEHQEHFVSSQVMRHLEALINAVPDPTREQTILVGCPPGELHTYPSLFLSLLLRRKGYKVIDLGADIPLDHMQTTINKIKPDLVVMAAQQLTTAASIWKVSIIMQSCGVAFAYGGSIFNRIPSLRNQIPAYFLGENLADTLTLIESLLSHTFSPAIKLNLADDHQESVAWYQGCRTGIELAVSGYMQRAGLSIDQINGINSFLGERITAALAFGSPSLLEPDMKWLREWHSIRQLPPEFLTGYLRAYDRALEECMGANGESISNWMKVLVTKFDESHQ